MKSIWTTPLCLIALLLATGCNPSEPVASDETPEVVVRVQVAQAKTRPVSQQSVAQGTIFPLRQATVSAVQGGQISTMPLWKNRHVDKGETLAELNMRDLEAQRNEARSLVREAEVNLHNLQHSANPLAAANARKELAQTASTLRNARALLERRQALFQEGGIALKDLQDSQLALSLAQANYTLSQRSAKLLSTATTPGSVELARTKLDQARLRVATLESPLSFAQIRAPISGTVIDQFQFLGEFVTPGTRLLTIADLSEVIVKGQFADTVMARLRVGEQAEVRPLDRPGVKLVGRVSALSAVTDAQSRSGEVWVNLSNRDGRLRSGGVCEVSVQAHPLPAVMVPASAVTRDTPESQEGQVCVVDSQGIAHHRKVRCGIQQSDWMEISSGLKAGETVVTEGNYALPDNQRVSTESSRP